MTEHATDLIILEPDKVDVPAAELGEGPCWDAETQSLYWVDIPATRVHRLSAAGVHSSWDVGRPAGAVVPRARGGLVVAAGNGFLSLDPLTGAVAELAAAPGQPGTRMNDGKCDRAGRFYAGSMADDESPGMGSFYRLDTDQRVTEIYTGIGISNGIGWSPDDRLMYYTDSLDYRVDVLDYDPATGQMGERRPFAALGSGEIRRGGHADGRRARSCGQRDQLCLRRARTRPALHHDRCRPGTVGWSAVQLRLWRARTSHIPLRRLIWRSTTPFGVCIRREPSRARRARYPYDGQRDRDGG